MALADLTTQQRNKLRIMLNDVAVKQNPEDPQKFIINQLFDSVFDTNTQRAARVEQLVTIWRNIRQLERDNADTENAAHKAALDSELAELDAIVATA